LRPCLFLVDTFRRLRVASEAILTHKRKTNKLLARKIRGLILRKSFHDRNLGEIISTMTRLDVMLELHDPVEVHLVPHIEKGEVLLDLRRKGSLQH